MEGLLALCFYSYLSKASTPGWINFLLFALFFTQERPGTECLSNQQKKAEKQTFIQQYTRQLSKVSWDKLNSLTWLVEEQDIVICVDASVQLKNANRQQACLERDGSLIRTSTDDWCFFFFFFHLIVRSRFAFLSGVAGHMQVREPVSVTSVSFHFVIIQVNVVVVWVL